MAEWYFRNHQGGGGLKSCPGCRNLVRGNEEFCPYCARRLRPAGGVRGFLKRLEGTPFIATRVLLGLIAAAFLLQMVADLLLPEQYRHETGFSLFGLLSSYPATYVRMGSNQHLLVYFYHEYWRLVTYCFLHGGLLHIMFNCWAFWDLGRLSERLWGARQVFAAFILTGIVGGAASFGWDLLTHLSKPVTMASNSIGASGAICGLLGLLLGAYYRNKYQIGSALGQQLVQWAVLILVFGLVGGFDNAAHIGGMASGAALGYFLPPTVHSRTIERDMKIWNALFIISAVLLVISVGCAIVFYAQGPGHLDTL